MTCDRETVEVFYVPGNAPGRRWLAERPPVVPEGPREAAGQASLSGGGGRWRARRRNEAGGYGRRRRRREAGRGKNLNISYVKALNL